MQTTSAYIQKATAEAFEELEDDVAIEEPLELRINGASVSLSMRTPGHDVDLALGFFLSEGVIRDVKDVKDVKSSPRFVDVVLTPERPNEALKRLFLTNSSCGVCSKTSLDSLALRDCNLLPSETPKVPCDTLFQMPTILRSRQTGFNHTGGLHAAGLFDKNGEPIVIREDVGRHNALDKVIGTLLKKNLLPFHDGILMLSGRVSFELMQKAMMAGVPIVAAVGAPSSLAISVAQRFNMTLIGFLQKDRFNLYAGAHRIIKKSQ